MTWYDTDYAYKKKITIDHTKVDGDETDFPVLISVTDADLADTSNSGQVESANGYDIIFTNDDEDTLLKHEIQSYDNTDGTLIYWVKVDSLSSTVDTDIYIYYGKSGVVVDPSTTDTWDSGYDIVYHMEDASGNIADSAGTNTGTANSILYHQAGKIGYSVGSNNSSDYIVTSSGVADGVQLTWSAWMYDSNFSSKFAIDNRVLGTGYQPLLFLGDSSAKDVQFYNSQGGEKDELDTSADITSNTWNYVVVVLNTNMVYAYVGGSLSDSSGHAAYDHNAKVCTLFNRYSQDKNNVSFMDEVRISSTARSANWISTSFETQNDPANFMDWGAEEEKPAGETLTPSDTAKALDSLVTAITHPFSDTARASDSFVTDIPSLPYPCDTFTLHGTSTNILFPKPEWGNPDNSISKSISLFDFWTGDIDTVDRGISAQPLAIGGVVSIFADTPSWANLAAMTTWLDSIKTAMNNGEKFTINELEDCLNGVYVVKDFTFNTIVGTINAWSWSLNLERVRDV